MIWLTLPIGNIGKLREKSHLISIFIFYACIYVCMHNDRLMIRYLVFFFVSENHKFKISCLCISCLYIFPTMTGKLTKEWRTSEPTLSYHSQPKAEEKEGIDLFSTTSGVIMQRYFLYDFLSTSHPMDQMNTLCFLICCKALVLISLKSSLRLPVMPVASQLGHMTWFDKDNLPAGNNNTLFAMRQRLWYAYLTVVWYYYRGALQPQRLHECSWIWQ